MDKITKCPRCNGKMFITHEDDGDYWECLNCSHAIAINKPKKVLAVSRTLQLCKANFR